MISQEVIIKDKKYKYVNMKLGENAPLIILKGSTGYIMCGYLNMEAANTLGDIAVRVAGVNDVNDVLNTEVNSCSRRAQELGIKPGDKIIDIIDRL